MAILGYDARDLSRGSRGGSSPRERERVDPYDMFMEGVNLPRGMDREHTTRTLTTVGAFHVVPANDLHRTKVEELAGHADAKMHAQKPLKRFVD